MISFGQFQHQTIMITVHVPLKGVPIIQKILFWPSDCHIKKHKKCVLAWFLRGLATNRERPLLAQVRYLLCPNLGGSGYYLRAVVNSAHTYSLILLNSSDLYHKLHKYYGIAHA